MGSRTRFEHTAWYPTGSAVAPALDPFEPRERAAHRRSASPRAVRSRRKASAALLAARSQDGAATARAHAAAEAVLLGTLADVGLIRALHDSSKPWGRPAARDVRDLGFRGPDTDRERGHRLTSAPHRTLANGARQHLNQHPWIITDGAIGAVSPRIPSFPRNHIDVISCSTDVIRWTKTPLDQGFRSFPQPQFADVDPVGMFAARADGHWGLRTRGTPRSGPAHPVAICGASSTSVDDAVNRGVEQGGATRRCGRSVDHMCREYPGSGE